MGGEILAYVNPLIFGVLLICTALNVLAAVLLGRRSLPQRLQIKLDVIEAKVAACAAGVDEFAQQNAISRATLGGLIEEAEGVFGKIERKRASVAATTSRLEAASAQVDEHGIPIGATGSERMAHIARLGRARGM